MISNIHRSSQFTGRFISPLQKTIAIIHRQRHFGISQISQAAHSFFYSRIACQISCLLRSKCHLYRILSNLHFSGLFVHRRCVDQNELHIRILFLLFINHLTEQISICYNQLCTTVNCIVDHLSICIFRCFRCLVVLMRYSLFLTKTADGIPGNLTVSSIHDQPCFRYHGNFVIHLLFRLHFFRRAAGGQRQHHDCCNC